MTIEKLSKKCYRVRQMVAGKLYSVKFDHKPTKREAEAAMREKLQDVPRNVTPSPDITFEEAMKAYNQMKEPVLSPATIADYYGMPNRVTDEFKNLKVGKITAYDMQKLINDYTPGHAEKTVKNLNGYVQAVLKTFRPGFTGFKVNIKKTVKEEPYIPTSEEIKKVVAASKGTPFEYVIALACYGLRRSEAAAVTADDIDLKTNTLTINKSMVYSRHGTFVLKNYPKTSESIRTLVIDHDLAVAICQAGKACFVYPNNTIKWLYDTCDELGIKHFQLHKIRHWVCTELHAAGLPEADILKYCGWSQSGDIMRAVYRHSRIDKDREKAQNVANKITSLIK